MTLQPILQQYLDLGWYLLPVYEIADGACACGESGCRAAGKHPRAGLGLKHASRDAETIARWAKQWPACSWAVACRRSGFIAIDVDPRGGGNATFAGLTSSLGEVPAGPVQKTGGNGRHYLVRVPKGHKIRGKLGPGVDLKANGYILIEPSSHISGGVYVWATHPQGHPIPDLPQTWLEAATVRAPERSPAPVIPFQRDTEEEIESALEAIPADDRDVWLQVGMAIKSAVGDGGYALWDRWSQASEKYDAKDAAKIWASMRAEGGITKATLFKLAYKNGWVAPRPQTPRAPAPPRNDEEPPPHDDEDAPPDIHPAAPADEWRHGLVWTESGVVTRDPGNAALILTNDPQWEDCLRFNEFSCQIEWAADPPVVAGYPRPEGRLRDEHVGHAQHWLRLHYGGSFMVEAVRNAIKTAAMAHTYHPVRDYLSSLSWDGRERIGTWLQFYLCSQDTEILRTIGRWWLISAVARIYKPGCQADHTLILEGPQGCGKSSTLSILGGEWYKDGLGDLRNKDAKLGLQGSWIIEIAELDSFKGQRSTAIKQFLTDRFDKFRPPFGREEVIVQRQCIFAGSTNETGYLQDASGGRRFWPARMAHLRRRELLEDRDQLWAEAVAALHTGELWWPESQNQLAELADIQEERYEGDPWEESVAMFVERPRLTDDDITIKAILDYLDLPAGQRDRAAQGRIGKILARLEYFPVRIMKNGARSRCYAKK